MHHRSCGVHKILFYFILFYSILFYSILFYSILFYSILFYSILFYSILFYSILFYSILFYSTLLYSTPRERLKVSHTQLREPHHSRQTTTHLQLPPSLTPSLPSAAAAAINDVRQQGVRRRHHPGPHVRHQPRKCPARTTILVLNPISMTVDMGVAMRRTRAKRARRIRGWLAAGGGSMATMTTIGKNEGRQRLWRRRH
jgi:hypothetical protein